MLDAGREERLARGGIPNASRKVEASRYDGAAVRAEGEVEYRRVLERREGSFF